MRNKNLSSKEYAKLSAKADRILEKETKKAMGARDDALIDECMETLRYCNEREAIVKREELETKKDCSGRIKLKRAAIAACLVLVVLIVSASIAQAAGFKVWSALVHWDKNYLTVNSAPTQENDPEQGQSVENTGEIQGDEIETVLFDAEAEMIAQYGDKLLFANGANDLEFVKGEVSADPGGLTAIVKYEYEGQKLTFSETYKNDALDWESDYHSESHLGIDEVYEKEIRGITCTVGKGNESSFLTFTTEHLMFSMHGAIPIDVMEKIAETIILNGKIGNTYNGNTTVNEACAIPSNYSGIKYYY